MPDAICEANPATLGTERFAASARRNQTTQNCWAQPAPRRMHGATGAPRNTTHNQKVARHSTMMRGSMLSFGKSGVSKEKVRPQSYMHDLPPAPSNQCWGSWGGPNLCPNKNSLFHPKPETLTHATLPNNDWGGRGGHGRITCVQVHFFLRNTGTREDPVHWLQGDNRILNMHLVQTQ